MPDCDCDYCLSQKVFPKNQDEESRKQFLIGIFMGFGLALLVWSFYHLAKIGECVCY